MGNSNRKRKQVQNWDSQDNVNTGIRLFMQVGFKFIFLRIFRY